MMRTGDGFLLQVESVVEEARGAVLMNLNVPGTLFVTNFRLVFLGENAQQPLPLGTIPLLTIENFSKQAVKRPVVFLSAASKRLLTVVGKDLRTLTFGFLPHTKQRRKIRNALEYRTRPTRIWDLYAFIDAYPTGGDPRDRLRAEYLRLISGNTRSTIEQPHRDSGWRLCTANETYTVCPTYPSLMVMPTSISDEEVQQAALFRSRHRLVHLCWQHQGNGAVLARTSQPLTVFGTSRSAADEKLVAAVCDTVNQRRKLYIADARPITNAVVNVVKGGGLESSAHYLQSEVVYLGIDNIHTMRDSLTKIRDFLDTHGATSSDGSSSLTRSGRCAWIGGNVTSIAGAATALGNSGWLVHCHKILLSAMWIAARIHLEGASVLVHCSDGWDRTAQLVCLASLLLDPYYRTFEGFQGLIEKDWLAFGHLFSKRLGIPTYTGMQCMSATLENSSSSSGGSHSAGAQSSEYSPIFFQWIDAVAQLLRIYPSAFEFTQAYLVELMDCIFACRFGNFLCNCEKERVQGGVTDAAACVWAHLKQLREPKGRKHEYYNLLYNSAQNVAVLLPPAAASAPSLWHQYFLRWSCPSLANTGGNPPTGWVHGDDLEGAIHGHAKTLEVEDVSEGQNGFLSRSTVPKQLERLGKVKLLFQNLMREVGDGVAAAWSGLRDLCVEYVLPASVFIILCALVCVQNLMEGELDMLPPPT